MTGWGDGVRLGHDGALDHLVGFVRTEFGHLRLAGGHRVVHGGAEHARPVRVDAKILSALEKYVPLAPLHQPHNLSPIRLLLERLLEIVQVTCLPVPVIPAGACQSTAAPPRTNPLN